MRLFGSTFVSKVLTVLLCATSLVGATTPLPRGGAIAFANDGSVLSPIPAGWPEEATRRAFAADPKQALLSCAIAYGQLPYPSDRSEMITTLYNPNAPRGAAGREDPVLSYWSKDKKDLWIVTPHGGQRYKDLAPKSGAPVVGLLPERKPDSVARRLPPVGDFSNLLGPNNEVGHRFLYSYFGVTSTRAVAIPIAPRPDPSGAPHSWRGSHEVDFGVKTQSRTLQPNLYKAPVEELSTALPGLLDVLGRNLENEKSKLESGSRVDNENTSSLRDCIGEDGSRFSLSAEQVRVLQDERISAVHALGDLLRSSRSTFKEKRLSLGGGAIPEGRIDWGVIIYISYNYDEAQGQNLIESVALSDLLDPNSEILKRHPSIKEDLARHSKVMDALRNLENVTKRNAELARKSQSRAPCRLWTVISTCDRALSAVSEDSLSDEIKKFKAENLALKTEIEKKFGFKKVETVAPPRRQSGGGAGY